MDSKKGSTSKLLLFLAAVIVAGIAAGILITTAVTLQSKSLHVGRETRSELSTAFTVMDVYAEDGTNPPSSVQYFYARLRSDAGSDGIKMEEVALSVLFHNGTAELKATETNAPLRNCTYTGDQATSGFWTDNGGFGNFSYFYEKRADNHRDGYLLNGDVVSLCFMTPYDIPIESKMQLDFIVRGSFPKNVELMTPDFINTKRVKVYP